MVNMDYNELYKYIADFSGVHSDDMTPDHSLSNDLGIYGDDASDLIIDFSKKFKVDISSFNFDEYFEGEGDMISKFFVGLFSKKKNKKDLKIKDLKNAIESGRLV